MEAGRDLALRRLAGHAAKVTSDIPHKWRDLLLLALLSLVAYLPGLAALPPIDRDEARYAQATVQMIETGDYIDIRFQDDARHKKPAGAYWAQVASLTATGQIDDVKRGERAIWAHRLPSVFGALIAVWATYLCGIALLGRREALIGAGFLALSISLVFEAHIAKTDALLAGAAAVTLYGLSSRKPWPSWLGLAVGMLVKGPILLGVAMIALAVEAVWNRSFGRIRGIISPLPILMALLIAVPWFVAIGMKTDGAFFAEALGRDFGGKMTGAQESHGGPPGYYALSSLAMFWPGIIAIPLVGLMAWRQRSDTTVRWLIAWIVPMWLILELVPTKLPHYTLPLYPALALLAGAAWVRVETARGLRWVGLTLFGLTAVLLCGVVGYLTSTSMDNMVPRTLLWTATLAMPVGFAVWAFATRRDRTALALSAVFLGLGFALLSRSELFDLSPRLTAALPANTTIVSPDYREPSLVFLTSTQTRLNRNARPGDTLVLASTTIAPDCATQVNRVSGVNYAKGDALSLQIFNTDQCTAAALQSWAQEPS